jgi:hypothetical protein
MFTKNKKILIIVLPLALILIILGLVLFTKNNEKKEPINKDWSIGNQTSLLEAGFTEYISQDLSEPVEKRKQRLQKYFTQDSPVFDYGLQEIERVGADRSDGEVVETRDCHEQEGDDLCLIIRTKINYYNKNQKIKTEITPYWITIDYISKDDFKIYDLGVWDYDYNEDPI